MAEAVKNRRNKNSRFARNKAAFEDVLGNPFMKPESRQGHYQLFKTKSIIKAMVYSDETNATKNNCQPSVLDFFCDVDNVVSRAMKTKTRLDLFIRTYITDEDASLFTPEEREGIEQQIGETLLELKISPITGYFQT
jgi:hypothetical protein